MANDLVKIAEDSTRGGLFLFLGNFLSTVVAALGSIVVARFLGPENYALYGLALSIPTLLLPFVDIGINPALTRFLARLRTEGRSSRASNLLVSGLLFKTVAGIGISVLSFALSDVFAVYVLNRPSIGVLVRLASLSIVFHVLFNAISAIFIGLDRMDRGALVMFLQSLIKAATGPLLVFLGLSVEGAILGYVFSFTVAGLTGVLLLLLHQRHTPLSFSVPRRTFWGDLRTLMGYGYPLFIAGILGIFLSQFKVILLALFVSDIELGNYYVVKNFAYIVAVFANPISTALFPAFSKVNASRDSSSLNRLFQLSVRYTSMVIVPVSTAIIGLASDLVVTLYGNAYVLTPFFLSLSILVHLNTGLGSIVLGNLFKGTGQTKISLRLNVVRALVFVPLAIISTSFFGIPGFIVASLLASLALLGYGLFLGKRMYNVTPELSVALRIYLSSFLSLFVLFLFLRVSPFASILNLALGGTVFLVTYLTLLPLSGAVKKVDVLNFETMFSRFEVLRPVLKLVLAFENTLLSVR
jgi:O-antigen/teichoic acid export membrane protein